MSSLILTSLHRFKPTVKPKHDITMNNTQISKPLQYALAMAAVHNTEGVVLFPKLFEAASLLIEPSNFEQISAVAFVIAQANTHIVTPISILGHN